jgi:hypothetical protein
MSIPPKNYKITIKVEPQDETGTATCELSVSMEVERATILAPDYRNPGIVAAVKLFENMMQPDKLMGEEKPE